MRRGSLLGSVTLAVCLAAASSAHATFPGQNGRIALSQRPTPTQSRSIFTVNPDGSDPTALTGPGTEDDDPAWSAEGRKIAYTSNIGGMRLMNFDGFGNRPFPLGGDPAWSPDGSKLVVSRGPALWVVNADGSGETQLTPGTLSSAGSPDWSPDGTKIAFGGATTGGSQKDIYTIKPDGTQLTNLTNNASANNGIPSWAPDGSKLVFWRNLGEIAVMNSDGTNTTIVASPGKWPVWSPDGERIAYIRSGSPYTIRTVNPDGTSDAPIALSLGESSKLSWQACQESCPVSDPQPYDAPAAARLIQFRLVPFFRQTISSSQCLARGGANSTHGPPLSFSSCSPIAYQPGSVARVGSNMEGGVVYKFLPGGYPNIYGDTMEFSGGITDVRTTSGGDYPAAITLVTRMRVTDRLNGPDFDIAATTRDFDFSVPLSCSPDPEPDFGSTCGGTTNAQAFMPESFTGHRRALVQIFGLRVYDSGANGTRGDADDKIFAGQGIYIP